jgi:hypothetical protein
MDATSDRNGKHKVPNMQGAKNAAFMARAAKQHRLPWRSAVLVIAALSVLSWAAVIGFIAAFRVLG